MIPLAIAMRIPYPIFRSIFVKIAWEIEFRAVGQDLGAGRGNIWEKQGGPTYAMHIERETGLLARGALTLAANTAGV